MIISSSGCMSVASDIETTRSILTSQATAEVRVCGFAADRIHIHLVKCSDNFNETRSATKGKNNARRRNNQNGSAVNFSCRNNHD